MRVFGEANKQPMTPKSGPSKLTNGQIKKKGIPYNFQLSRGWNMWRVMLVVIIVSKARKIEKPKKY